MQQGILSQRPEQGAPQSQGKPQQPAQQPGQDQTMGTQEQFDVVAGQMLNYLYSEEGVTGLETLLGSGDPAKGMARYISRLLIMSAQTAVMSGKMIPPNVLFQAGMQLAKGVSEIAQKMGVLTPENEAQTTEDAFYEGMAMFAQEAGDEALTDNQRQAYVSLLNKLEQMQGGGQPKQEQQMQPQAPAPGGKA